MARRPALVKTKKKVTRAAPIRRGKASSGPDFAGWEKMTGQQFNKYKHNAKYFYYENVQEDDLLPEVWLWMKENNYSTQDIRYAKAAKGMHSINVWPAIMCKMLHTGCPDYNKAEADYWEPLPGTGDVLHPMSKYIKDRIAAAITVGEKIVQAEKQAEVAAAKVDKPVFRQNIQELMRERASDAFGEIEGLADEYIIAGCPKEFPTKDAIMGFLNEKKILPQHVPAYIKHWETLKAEIEEAKEGKCPQLNEGYAKYTRTQLNNKIKFADQVIENLTAYVAIKQADRAPRVRKAVPIYKIVAKLKHLKVFKDDTLKLDLVGLPPEKLHTSQEAWVYDTRKRKMHHYVADDYSKCLMIKGNTLLGFDKRESGIKTLRKPAEQIKALTGSKPAARKYFGEIKSVVAIPTGRFNEDMIILKAF
jgi:hypothetical protein